VTGQVSVVHVLMLCVKGGGGGGLPELLLSKLKDGGSFSENNKQHFWRYGRCLLIRDTLHCHAGAVQSLCKTRFNRSPRNLQWREKPHLQLVICF